MIYFKCLEFYEIANKEYIDSYSKSKRNEYKTTALTKAAQLFKNYDYADNSTGPGASVYTDMDKYKSVMDFRKKNRKRRMELIRKLREQKQTS